MLTRISRKGIVFFLNHEKLIVLLNGKHEIRSLPYTSHKATETNSRLIKAFDVKTENIGMKYLIYLWIFLHVVKIALVQQVHELLSVV